jgi:hypothetical protein
MTDCPCCGQSVSGAVPVGGLKALLRGQPTAEAIIDVLAKVYPSGLPRQAIADRVYARLSSGGPPSAENVISVTLHRLRPLLKDSGWRVAGARGRNGSIKLQRITQQ